VCELTYAKYKRAVTKPTKELEVMDIDWSKAPDDCAGALQHKDIDYKYTHGRFVRSCTSFDNYEYCMNEEIYPCMDFFTLIPRPEAQPVFTQAMADNGESIKAGMLFQYNSGEKTELLLPIDESGMGVAMFDGEYCIVCQSGMLPIDTRTDKEKAIDAIDKLITNAYQETTDNFASNSRFRVEAEHLMDEIIDGTIAGVKWVGE